MTNIYTWVIESLDCIPSADKKTNIVSNVHWRVYADSAQTKQNPIFQDGSITVPMYSATAYGSQPLIYVANAPFINYSDLTKDTVVGWVQEAMGIDDVTKLQETLDKQLEALGNPSVITPPLPW